MKTMKQITVLLLILVASISAGDFIKSYSANNITFDSKVWDRFSTTEEAEENLNSQDLDLRFKALITLFHAAFETENKSQSLEFITLAANTMDKLFKRNRSNFLIATMAGTMSLAKAGKDPNLKNKIRYTNSGIAAFNYAMSSNPTNLEMKALYLRSTVEVPTFFKNLNKEMLSTGNEFLASYHEFEKENTITENLKRNKNIVAIVLAEVASREDSTKEDVKKYITQVDANLLPYLPASNHKLLEYYEKHK